MKAHMKVLRRDPKRAGKPRYRTYTVPFSAGDKVLGGLLYIYTHLDPCLSFRFNCKGRHCGECAMMINGRPGLSCAAPMSRDLTLEPLRNLPVIKDLVIDRGQVYRSVVERLPVIDGNECEGKGLRAVPLDTVDRVVRLDDCIQCLCCMAVCPAYKKEPGLFLGPFGLLALAAMTEELIGVDASEKAAACTECGLCEKVCPRRIPIFSEAIRTLKSR
jgi:succinate dehydrogenase/fumarate reductase iron-sulfur protein